MERLQVSTCEFFLVVTTRSANVLFYLTCTAKGAKNVHPTKCNVLDSFVKWSHTSITGLCYRVVLSQGCSS